MFSDSTRKRLRSSDGFSSCSCSNSGPLVVPSGSPPHKRNSANVLPCPENTQVSTSSVSEGASSVSLDDRVREVYAQYHDNLRALKRDVQFMVTEFSRIRDERISFYTRHFSRSLSTPTVETSSVVIDDLTQDITLDIATHGSVSVSHQ